MLITMIARVILILIPIATIHYSYCYYDDDDDDYYYYYYYYYDE